MKKSLLYSIIGGVLGAAGIFVEVKAHKAECEELYQAGYNGVVDAAKDIGMEMQDEEPKEEQ